MASGEAGFGKEAGRVRRDKARHIRYLCQQSVPESLPNALRRVAPTAHQVGRWEEQLQEIQTRGRSNLVLRRHQQMKQDVQNSVWRNCHLLAGSVATDQYYL